MHQIFPDICHSYTYIQRVLFLIHSRNCLPNYSLFEKMFQIDAVLVMVSVRFTCAFCLVKFFSINFFCKISREKRLKKSSLEIMVERVFYFLY